MCGICGIVRFSPAAPGIVPDELRAMSRALRRRGPDGEGEWSSKDGRAAFAHRRLAILDLSDAAAQPMADPTGRYRLLFNGEIYNFRELRAGLEARGRRFATRSDTELLLALWSEEGERCLPRLRGMYAFALHDALEGTTTLARDPFGIKPLYYSVDGGVLRFASQVKALEAAGVSKEVDPAGLVGFLLWGSVPEPWTIRSAVRALPAGHRLRVTEGRGLELRPVPWPELDSPAIPPAEALAASVRAHLVSDVPIALFLSAGLDSALLAALTGRELAAGEPLSTFTVRFEGWEGEARDEGPLAARVAAALGLSHVERKLSRRDVAAAWPETLAAMDQPSIDGFNTFVVARAAHEAGIKVALSGLGGDELLGGYPSFRDVPRWAARARRVASLPGVPALWPRAAGAIAPDMPKLAGMARYGASLPGAYFLRRGLFLPEELPGWIGEERARAGLAEHDPVRYADCALGAPPERSTDEPLDDWESVQRLEIALYLRNQLLRDADWAAMASSVELRVPFVDPRLHLAFARAGFEPAKSGGKAAFYRELARDVAPALPAELFERPKSGFAVPVAEWMLPPRAGERDTPGKASRRLAIRLLEEWGVR